MAQTKSGFLLGLGDEASSFSGRPASLSFIAAAIVLALMICGIAVSGSVSSMRPKYEPQQFGLAHSAPSTSALARIEASSKPAKAAGAVDDHELYARIIARVAQGENYYAAAADEQRLGNYPLKPFLTMRLPTLAWIEAMLGQIGVLIAAIALAAVTVFAWHRRFNSYWRSTDREHASLVPALIIFMGMIPLFWTKWQPMHEVWAGVLITLSIALYRPQNPLPAIFVAFAALAIRETSLPYLLLLAAFLLWEKQWRYVLLIIAGTALFFVAIAEHAQQVAAVVQPDDLASQGWFKAGGLATYLLYAQETTVLRSAPVLSAIAVPLCLLGWLSMKSQTGLLIFLFQVGYAFIFMVIGRADNFYWGMMIAPTLLAGLLFAPSAIKTLWRNRRAPVRAAAL